MHPLHRRLISLFLSLAVTIGVSAEIRLPDMGDPSATQLSSESEAQLGQALLRKLRQQGKIIDDPLITGYIASLGYRLAASSGYPDKRFTFFVVNDEAINAFAAPGGYIGINSGLILASRSESELAAVMAHEIAHVTQRHLARAFENAGQLKIPMAAALLAAILLGGQNPQLGEAAIAVATAGNIQSQINFTRSNEAEADAIGIATLADAGFDPIGMSTFFERLQQEARLYGISLPEFLRTHPVNESRIAESRNRAEQLAAVRSPDPLAYQLAHSRVRALFNGPPEQRARELARNLASGQYRSREAEEYGYALALTANRDYREANTTLQRLLDQGGDRIEYLLAQAETELALNRPQRALALFDEALALYPDSYPLTLAYARALLNQNRPERAVRLLQRQLNRHPDDPLLHQMLAEVLGKSGRKAEAHGELASYYYLNGHLLSAIEQLELALKQPDLDHYQSSRLQANLDRYRAEHLEEPRNPSN